MNTNPFSFATKKDKEDAIIAGLVILFFGVLGFHLADSTLFASQEIALNNPVQPTDKSNGSALIGIASNDSVKIYDSLDEWAATEGEPIAEEYVYLPFKDSSHRFTAIQLVAIQPKIANEKTSPISKPDSVVQNVVVGTNDSMAILSENTVVAAVLPKKELDNRANTTDKTPAIVAPKKEPKKEITNTVVEKQKPSAMSFPTQKQQIKATQKSTEIKADANNAMASPVKKEPVKTNPAKPQVEVTAKKEMSTNDTYCVAIIGSFKDQANVEKLTKKFAKQGYKVYKTNRNGLTAVGVYVDCGNPKPVFNKIRSEFGTGVWLLKSKD